MLNFLCEVEMFLKYIVLVVFTQLCNCACYNISWDGVANSELDIDRLTNAPTDDTQRLMDLKTTICDIPVCAVIYTRQDDWRNGQAPQIHKSQTYNSEITNENNYSDPITYTHPGIVNKLIDIEIFFDNDNDFKRFYHKLNDVRYSADNFYDNVNQELRCGLQPLVDMDEICNKIARNLYKIIVNPLLNNTDINIITLFNNNSDADNYILRFFINSPNNYCYKSEPLIFLFILDRDFRIYDNHTLQAVNPYFDESN